MNYKRLKLFLIIVILPFTLTTAQKENPTFNYTVSISNPSSHTYQVGLITSGWNRDTVQFNMPAWMPGYYQIMDYSDDVCNILAIDKEGKEIQIDKMDNNSWQVSNVKNKTFSLSYDIKTKRQFVANSYVDSLHAYIIPCNTFLYVDGYLDTPVTVRINNNPSWNYVATSLETVGDEKNLFIASDFDLLFDSPFLLGNLEELPSFNVNGIEHRFIGYNIGDFDKVGFINKLKAVVESAVNFIGDIPYKKYTFIAIGPGLGGIEHLDNTTISFDGNRLDSDEAISGMMSFIAHEYFHHYNVKRIRPMELGPFDYSNGSKTNLLWISEGLTVYYEYLIVNRAGVIDDSDLIKNFEQHINSVENNPGRMYQSLAQSSYSTWEDGPFGNQGENKGKTISYYEKGPMVGLLLDFTIRNATQNEKSLDDVMRSLYWEYYKKKNRGFTDAEFQQACETVAGISLSSLFEYVYTTKEIDYSKYLNYAGLELIESNDDQQKKNSKIERIKTSTSLQKSILNSWLGN